MSESTPSHDVLTRYLAERDEPCPLCDYNLRGLTGDHCPECGKQLKLPEELKVPGRIAYVLGGVALASQFGLSLLFLVWFTIWMILRDPQAVMPLWMFIPAMTLVSGALFAILVRNEERFLRQSPIVRCVFAAFCLMAPVVGVLVFLFSSGVIVKN